MEITKKQKKIDSLRRQYATENALEIIVVPVPVGTQEQQRLTVLHFVSYGWK